MPALHNHLLEPVIVITKGRGVERFDDTRRLFARLEEIPTLGDSIMSIQHGGKAVPRAGIAALETMLAKCGFVNLDRVGRKRGAPFNRPGTRWAWQHLSDYLGWEWRDL